MQTTDFAQIQALKTPEAMAQATRALAATQAIRIDGCDLWRGEHRIPIIARRPWPVRTFELADGTTVRLDDAGRELATPQES